jgi:hypothetical protein
MRCDDAVDPEPGVDVLSLTKLWSRRPAPEQHQRQGHLDDNQSAERRRRRRRRGVHRREGFIGVARETNAGARPKTMPVAKAIDIVNATIGRSSVT